MARKPYKHTRDEVRVIRAIAQMPYGGLVRHPRGRPGFKGRVGGPAHPITAGAVADYLEELKGILQEIGEREEREEHELNQLRADVAAMRRLMGTVR